MRSTMMTTPLQVSRLLQHGSTVHGSSEVITWTAEGPRRTPYSEIGARAARLAGALRGLGITGDQRVGTLMWNNAEDKAVIVDSTLLPLLTGVIPHLTTLEHVIVVGDGDTAALAEAAGGRVQIHRWSYLLRVQSDHFAWPAIDENDAAALCYTS